MPLVLPPALQIECLPCDVTPPGSVIPVTLCLLAARATDHAWKRQRILHGKLTPGMVAQAGHIQHMACPAQPVTLPRVLSQHQSHLSLATIWLPCADFCTASATPQALRCCIRACLHCICHSTVPSPILGTHSTSAVLCLPLASCSTTTKSCSSSPVPCSWLVPLPPCWAWCCVRSWDAASP